MSTAEKLNLITVNDYLVGELVSAIKHEYLGGNRVRDGRRDE